MWKPPFIYSNVSYDIERNDLSHQLNGRRKCNIDYSVKGVTQNSMTKCENSPNGRLWFSTNMNTT